MFDINRLKLENPAEDVVARYVPLRRQGRTLVGHCPFHDDRNPSFVVWPGGMEGHWYCFGCGMGGDVLDFLMRKLQVSFKEACRILEAGKLPELPTPPPRVAPVEAVTLGPVERQALGLAVRVYHTRLWSLPVTHPARQYLANRGTDPDTIRRFAIGWCSGEDLRPVLRFLRLKPQVFQDLGLLGRRSEFFRGRIVIPDRDPTGMVEHMVGRSLGSEEPRYLALPGLPKPLYGLSSVQRQKPVVVVEGIFCRLSLEQRGVQAVAVMGTALGARARALKAIPALYLVPQNDEAGERALREWLAAIGHGQVIRLPAGVKDVNELDQAGGLEQWLDTWADWR